jgi:glycosyltransferase involved in cell wall biosynthesis
MEPVAHAALRDSSLVRERVAAVVPVLNEADALGGVVTGLLENGVDVVVVVDGNSQDDTAARGREAGAIVIIEPRRGYGRVMMTGIARLPQDIAIVLFFDGDGTDRTELVPLVVAPIRERSADFVMGSRLNGEREPGSLGAVQIVAGHLAGFLIRAFYGVRFTDMSPFRALRRETLAALGMREKTFGSNLEMQMRVAMAGLRTEEIPVGQRRRVGGISKVSGDWRTAIRAGWVIARTFAKLAMELVRVPNT